MNWKFWQRPQPIREAPPRLILHGWTEAQLRHAFLTAPDNDLYRGTLEQCDKLLMETVNELVNQAEDMSDGKLRQRVGQLRGLTELREQLEQRAAQARQDQTALQKDQTEEQP